MTTDRDDPVHQCAASLVAVHRDGGTVERDHLAGLADVEAAYRVQDLLWQGLTDGRADRPAGYKVSFTIPDVQAWVGASEPASGPFLPHQVLPSGSRWPRASFRDPVLEPEVVFHLTDDLPLEPSREDVRGCATVSLGIEICDSRVRGWLEDPQIVPIIADGGASGVLVTGAGPTRPVPRELASATVDLAVDGRFIASGTGDRVLGDPIEAVVWLAGHLARRGRRLHRGMVVSSGALTKRPVAAEPGTYTASSPQLGEVAVELVAS